MPPGWLMDWALNRRKIEAEKNIPPMPLVKPPKSETESDELPETMGEPGTNHQYSIKLGN